MSRIVFGPEREVLELGRKRRVVSTAQRRAVIARDRHCVWGGCGRRPSWCDVHHVVPWVERGATELNNLVLLCRYHHTLVHAIPVHQLELAELRQPATPGRSS